MMKVTRPAHPGEITSWRYRASLEEEWQNWSARIDRCVLWIWYFRPVLDIPTYFPGDSDGHNGRLDGDPSIHGEIVRRMLAARVPAVELCGLRRLNYSDPGCAPSSGSDSAGIIGKSLRDFEPMWTTSMHEYVIWRKYWKGSPDVPRYLIVRKSNGVAVRFADHRLWFEVLRRMLDAAAEVLEFCTMEAELTHPAWEPGDDGDPDAPASMLGYI